MTTGKTRPRFGKRIAAVCLGAAAAAAIGWAGHRTSGRLGAAWRLSRGRAAYARGEWWEAAVKAQGVLMDDPENQAALVLLARSFARSGRGDQAAAVYRRVKPNALEAEDHLIQGDDHAKAGRQDLAASAWRNAEIQGAGGPDPMVRLAPYYLERGMPLEALSRAEKLAGDPTKGPTGAWIKAQAYHTLDEPEKALEPVERVLKADSDSLRRLGIERSQVVSLAARVNLGAGRPARALEILGLDPKAAPDRESRWLASRALLQQGKAKEAEAVLAALATPESPMTREPAAYTGAVSCRPCHASNYETQQSSRHALTFHDHWDGPTVPDRNAEVPDPAWNKVRHRLTNDGEATRLETTVVDRTYRAIVRYVVGSGRHGETLMVEDEEGDLRESRISYQPRTRRWSKTINHPDRPSDALGYLGRSVSADDSWKCVHCHTTTAASFFSPSPARPKDRSIGCEHCHGPGGNHLKAVELGFSDLAIVTPSAATAAETTELCAECHREPGVGVLADSPSFIRFQAPTFKKSRCYTESGSFSCVDCHNPHKDAETSPAVYEAVCLQCHSAAKPNDPASKVDPNAGARTVCPVNQTRGCLECHMPKVPRAVPGAEFTDHYIRVRKDIGTTGPQASLD